MHLVGKYHVACCQNCDFYRNWYVACKYGRNDVRKFRCTILLLTRFKNSLFATPNNKPRRHIAQQINLSSVLAPWFLYIYAVKRSFLKMTTRQEIWMKTRQEIMLLIIVCCKWSILETCFRHKHYKHISIDNCTIIIIGGAK